MSKINRSWIAVTAAAVVAGAACTVSLSHTARAEDAMTAPSSDLGKTVMEQCDKGKAMAADPAQAEQLKMEMAKMMVMDQMAMKMAMDPQAKQALTDAMKDPAMMKVHTEAKAMAADPAQMQTMMTQVMADPKAMMMVMHHAAMMAMMQDKAGGMGGMMQHGEKMMGDKMNDMK